jgi:hypothetical protein
MQKKQALKNKNVGQARDKSSCNKNKGSAKIGQTLDISGTPGERQIHGILTSHKTRKNNDSRCTRQQLAAPPCNSVTGLPQLDKVAILLLFYLF